MEIFGIRMEDLRKFGIRMEDLRKDEMRELIINFFLSKFEVDLVASESDYSYDISVVENRLKEFYDEATVASVIFFINLLRSDILNNVSVEKMLVTLISFQTEARLLNHAFQD
jgi:hypothetical protein